MFRVKAEDDTMLLASSLSVDDVFKLVKNQEGLLEVATVLKGRSINHHDMYAFFNLFILHLTLIYYSKLF